MKMNENFATVKHITHRSTSSMEIVELIGRQMSIKFKFQSAHSILRRKANEDRIIADFPQPFKFSFTPYEEESFAPNVIQTCEEGRKNFTGVRSAKVIIVGDYAVGKTSMVNRFCHKMFDPNYKGTIGVDFEVQRFDVLGEPFNLQIWDTTGQEQFQSLMPAYYRRAHVIILTFDLMRRYSLHNISQWLNSTLENNGNNEPPLLFLVGTKSDLLSKPSYKMMEKEACQLASSIRAEYWSISSKTDENVKEFFFRVAALAFSHSVLLELEHNEQNESEKKSVAVFDTRKNKNNQGRSCGACIGERSSRN